MTMRPTMRADTPGRRPHSVGFLVSDVPPPVGLRPGVLPNRCCSRYLSQMPPLTAGQIAMEKSPSYLVTPGVAQRIRTMDPKVVIISSF